MLLRTKFKFKTWTWAWQYLYFIFFWFLSLKVKMWSFLGILGLIESQVVWYFAELGKTKDKKICVSNCQRSFDFILKIVWQMTDTIKCPALSQFFICLFLPDWSASYILKAHLILSSDEPQLVMFVARTNSWRNSHNLQFLDKFLKSSVLGYIYNCCNEQCIVHSSKQLKRKVCKF